MMLRAPGKRALLVALFLLGAETAWGQATAPTKEAFRSVYAAISRALDEPDPQAALALLEQHTAVVQKDPGLLYLKAMALTQAGRRSQATTCLRKLEAMDPGFEAATDPAFKALHLKLQRRPVVGSIRIAASLPLPDLFPEGVAVDPTTGRTFLSSLLHGGVLVLERSGAYRWFLEPDPAGPWSTLGLKIDSTRRLLWIASQGTPGRGGLEPGAAEHSALLAADLDTGRVVRRVPCTAPGKHLFNDMALAEDGTVYVTDSEAGTVLRLPPEQDLLEALLPPGTLGYPNGIVLTRDGQGLLVGAQGPGLYRLSLADRGLIDIQIPPGLHLQGIDGLSRYGHKLVGVQNGLAPGRVALLDLNEGETALRSIKVLAAGHPGLRGIPTTGAVVGTAFRFIVNSQITLLEEKLPHPAPANFLIADVPLPR
ncbi:hypothetical protein [Geothrix sp. PMB-07]|uniref:hypothetical protein n=1 Tax=Geothrix sp. PMB-07 TaxID=3068640 RepID=UPI002740F236|nr:hypothetical protein [Geothrix sp. PMB-07]WLT32007.1 hypothetical protein Q9293_01500 [Geothrix sp. PMB-07]